MSEQVQSFFSSPLGRLIMGIIKLALASMLMTLVSMLSNMAQGSVQVGNVSVPVGLILQILTAFFPIMLLVSALRDLGINI